MKKLLILGMLLLNAQAFAMSDKGNGGDGLWVNGKLYSLDLVEAGVEENPYFDSAIPLDLLIRSRISQKLDKEKFPVDLIAAKLSEIQAIDKVLATLILKGIELYQWRVVNSSLIDIKDEQSVLNFSNKNLVQLASRSLNSILIDRTLWSKLDEKNKTALVFHEILYALAPLDYTRNPYTGDYERNPITGAYLGTKFQSSPVARQATGHIFTSDFSRQGMTDLSDLGYTMSGGKGPILERKDDSTITYGDHFYLTGSLPQFKDPNNWINYGVGLDASDEKINQYVTESCTIVVVEESDLQFEWFYNTYTIDFNIYKTKTDEKTYLETISNFQNFKSPIDTSDLSECVKGAKVAINNYVKKIKENYR